MRISVTQEDIDKGERDSTSRCVIARAVSRAFDGAVTRVGMRTCEVRGHTDCGWMPDEVADFIGAWLDEQPVKPFEFDLRLS